ncbi:hypothetical protein DMENIID0001_057990 [Sergentomyia squamirostris]
MDESVFESNVSYERILEAIREAEETVRSVRASLRHRISSPVTVEEVEAPPVEIAPSPPPVDDNEPNRQGHEDGQLENRPVNVPQDCDDIVVLDSQPVDLPREFPLPMAANDSLDDEVILVSETINPNPVFIDLCSPCAAPRPPPAHVSSARKRKSPESSKTPAAPETVEPEVSPPAAKASNVDVFKCVICLENMLSRKPYSTICGHFFCMQCIKSAITISKKCPVCRKTLNQKNIHPIFP